MLLKSLPQNILLRLLKPDRWSIGIKILVAILLAAIVPMIVVVNYNLQQSLERIEKSQYNELELLASTKANQLDRLINDRKRELNAIIADSQVSGLSAGNRCRAPAAKFGSAISFGKSSLFPSQS